MLRLKTRRLRHIWNKRAMWPYIRRFRLRPVHFILSMFIGFVISHIIVIPVLEVWKMNTLRGILSGENNPFSASPNDELGFGRWSELEMAIQLEDTDELAEKMLYVVTPTNRRILDIQEAELIRVAQSLYLSKSFVKWLIVLDVESNSPDDRTHFYEKLQEFNIRLAIGLSVVNNPKQGRRGKGVEGRLAGLQYLLTKRNFNPGYVYFADDDNTYDFELFNEMRRSSSRVAMWPVGSLTELGLGTPIVDSATHKIVAFLDGWPAKRKFPVDFAGFAVSLNFLREEQAGMPLPHRTGRLEDSFLKSLRIAVNEIQPLAYGCTKILVWHTKQRFNYGHHIVKPTGQELWRRLSNRTNSSIAVV